MTQPLTPIELDALLEAARAATPGPYYVDHDDAEDCLPHKDSGLAQVDTGRADDWPIARLCEWPTARFIAAANPTTIERLVLMVRELEQEHERLLESVKKFTEQAYRAQYEVVDHFRARAVVICKENVARYEDQVDRARNDPSAIRALARANMASEIREAIESLALGGDGGE